MLVVLCLSPYITDTEGSLLLISHSSVSYKALVVCSGHLPNKSIIEDKLNYSSIQQSAPRKQYYIHVCYLTSFRNLYANLKLQALRELHGSKSL